MTTINDKIIIPISKTKLTLLLIVSLIFVSLGTIYTIAPKALVSPVFRSNEIIFIVGIACVIFFGLASFYIFKKLFDKRPGLIISTEGIFDNSSAASVGLIEWGDIIDTDKTEIFGQRIILIKVKNPKSYIKKQESKRTRNVLKANHNFYGTPIAITANGLKIKFENLEALLKEQIEKYRQ